MTDLEDMTPDAIDAAVQGKPAPSSLSASSTPDQRNASDVAALRREIARAQASNTVSPAAKAGQLDTLRAELAKYSGTVAPELADMTPDAIHAAVTAASPSAAPSAKPAAPVAKPGQITSPEFDLTANVLSGLGASAVGGVAGAGKFLWELGKTRSLDKAVDAGADTVRRIQEAGTYTPKTQLGQNMTENFGSAYNPLNWPSVAGEKIGGALADAGMPGAGALVNAGVTVGAPLAVKPVVRTATRTLSSLVNPSPVAPRIDPTMDPAPRLTAQDGTVLQQQVPPQPVMAGGQRVATPTQAANVSPVPRAPVEPFREIEPTDNPPMNTAEMRRRAQILASVGIDTARQSSLIGDRISGSTDTQLSRVDSPAGRLMQEQIDREKQALAAHATQLVERTGGTLDKDQSTGYQRGETIVQPLNELKAHYDARAGALYDAANERAQGQPVTLDGFRSMLADDSEMTSPDFVQFRDAAKAFAKKNGMLQEDGSISGTALQAETMRKWLNSKRNYSNGSFVDNLKQSLDGDVMSSAGEDLYKQARALWQEKKNTLDNPNGIGKLMQAEGPDGINRAIPLEQVAPKLARMPVDQFGHVVETLKNAPPEVQASATAALNEVRAHFANEVRNIGTKQQGQWNANGATKYLRENAAKMNQVFSPEEMSRFQNLSEAGQIVAKDQSYPGAAAQAHNLGRVGVTSTFLQNAATGAGTVAGGMIGGHAGAAVGANIGRAAGAKMVQKASDKASTKAAQQRLVPLSDLLDAGRGQ